MDHPTTGGGASGHVGNVLPCRSGTLGSERGRAHAAAAGRHARGCGVRSPAVACGVRHLDDEAVTQALSWPDVLEALRGAFAHPKRFDAPERVAMDAPQGGAFLTMPCADAEGWFGVKQVAVLPGNAQQGKPGVQAHYTLLDPQGTPVLSCAATLLTRMRTAGVSALAADRLVSDRARTLLVVGTGGLAPWMATAHLQVRAYERILVWGRDPRRAERTAADILARADAPLRPAVEPVRDLAEAAHEADVISCATSATEPPLEGGWLRERQHLDLVGAFRPGMAEVDAPAVLGSHVYVDDRVAAMVEAGDLLHARAAGWSFDRVAGDLHELVTGRAEPRAGRTLFKSVGMAFEDLVVARLLLG